MWNRQNSAQRIWLDHNTGSRDVSGKRKQPQNSGSSDQIHWRDEEILKSIRKKRRKKSRMGMVEAQNQLPRLSGARLQVLPWAAHQSNLELIPDAE